MWGSTGERLAGRPGRLHMDDSSQDCRQHRDRADTEGQQLLRKTVPGKTT